MGTPNTQERGQGLQGHAKQKDLKSWCNGAVNRRTEGFQKSLSLGSLCLPGTFGLHGAAHDDASCFHGPAVLASISIAKALWEAARRTKLANQKLRPREGVAACEEVLVELWLNQTP